MEEITLLSKAAVLYTGYEPKQCRAGHKDGAFASHCADKSATLRKECLGTSLWHVTALDLQQDVGRRKRRAS